MKKYLFSIIAAAFLLIPFLAQAYSAELIVNAGSESVNALEATIHVPNGVNIEKIYTGSSAILFWIEKPAYFEKESIISFSGIAPGGFRGPRAVLTISGNFTSADLPNFTFSGVRVLKNDGAGTGVEANMSFRPVTLGGDVFPPEPFNLIISSTPGTFEGKRFLAFAAEDKDTGIARYELASTWLFSPNDGDFLEVTPPIALSNKMLFKKLYVRAIDNAGNAQSASVAGPYHYATMFIGIIIILCVLWLLRRPRSSVA